MYIISRENALKPLIEGIAIPLVRRTGIAGGVSHSRIYQRGWRIRRESSKVHSGFGAVTQGMRATKWECQDLVLAGSLTESARV